MKKLSSSMKFLAVVAVCSFLVLPAVSSADDFKVLGTVEFGPGSNTETFYLDSQPMAFSATAAPVLKSISVAVQNGSGKGHVKKGHDDKFEKKSTVRKKQNKWSKKDRVSSARIAVNGEVIFEPKDFNHNVSSLIKTINVNDPALSMVELSAKVKGSKNARLSVTVTAVYEASAPPPVVQVPWFLDTDGNGVGGPIMAMGTMDTPPPFDPRGVWVKTDGDVR